MKKLKIAGSIVGLVLVFAWVIFILINCSNPPQETKTMVLKISVAALWMIGAAIILTASMLKEGESFLKDALLPLAKILGITSGLLILATAAYLLATCINSLF